MSGEWEPVHHEDLAPDQEQVAPARAEKETKAAVKADEKSDRGAAAIELTIPAHFTAGMWSLCEALEKNTEATREFIKELRAAREGGGERGI